MVMGPWHGLVKARQVASQGTGGLIPLPRAGNVLGPNFQVNKMVRDFHEYSPSILRTQLQTTYR